MTTKQEYTVEQAFEDLQRGIDLGISDLTAKLNVSLEELSKSEMERALGAIINYPDQVKAYSTREVNFIKNLVALHGLHLQAEIQALADLQKERDNINQGEENV